jgi:hypothetical protein
VGGCTERAEGDTEGVGLGVADGVEARGDGVCAACFEPAGVAASELPVQVLNPSSTTRSTAPTAARRRQ